MSRPTEPAASAPSGHRPSRSAMKSSGATTASKRPSNGLRANIRRKPMADSAPITIAHIARVRELLGRFCDELGRRGEAHDASKFDPVEKGPLDALQATIEKEGQVPYGTQEYRRRIEPLGPML